MRFSVSSLLFLALIVFVVTFSACGNGTTGGLATDSGIDQSDDSDDAQSDNSDDSDDPPASITSGYAGTLLRIEGDTFTMGSPESELYRSSYETQHEVTLTRAFYMGEHEVTQARYEAVMGNNPGCFRGANLPVERVSWYDAIVFCNKLSIKEGLTPAYTIKESTDPADWGSVPTGRDSDWNAIKLNLSAAGYRLPTEAEWEYTCRAGTKTAYSTGATLNSDYAWTSENSGSTTHAVGKKAANAWGLYDMHGNVWEWCWDWYEAFTTGAKTDPAGASLGSGRVLRGGCWGSSAQFARSAIRLNTDLWSRRSDLGFRVVRNK